MRLIIIFILGVITSSCSSTKVIKVPGEALSKKPLVLNIEKLGRLSASALELCIEPKDKYGRYTHGSKVKGYTLNGKIITIHANLISPSGEKDNYDSMASYVYARNFVCFSFNRELSPKYKKIEISSSGYLEVNKIYWHHFLYK